MKYEELKRGKLIYYITESAVVVYVGVGQYVSYNTYNTPSRSSLGEFKKKLRASKENEYGTAYEQMDLAHKCNLISSATRKPDWIKDE